MSLETADIRIDVGIILGERLLEMSEDPRSGFTSVYHEVFPAWPPKNVPRNR
jgi:hypothetical protein